MKQNAFKLFIDLISFDQSLYKTRKEIDTLQSEEARLSKSLEILLQDIGQGQERIKTLRKAVDEKELEMRDFEQKEKDLRKKLSQVHNDKEYQAIKHEADSLKKKQHDYEATLMEVWNNLDTAQKEVEKKEQELKEKKEILEKELQEKKEDIKKLQADLDNSAQEREQKLQGVPEEWLEKYGRMMHSVTNPVVLIENGSCMACFYNIPDQDVLRVKQQELIQCKGCYRFLYSKEEEVVTDE